jgi:hypothetical protein
MTATIIAIALRNKERKLIIPPRTDGENDSKIPISPKKIAIMARIKPPAAPTKKLAIAAPRAISEGRLKCGFVWLVAIMGKITPPIVRG